MTSPPPLLPPGRLRVGIVGAGKVGAVLGAALANAGHLVIGASAVSAASLARAEALLPDVPILPVDDVVATCDLAVLAVPDDALAPLVAGLATTDVWQRGQLALHTSGRSGLGPLAPAIALGVGGMAIHPAMSFTGTVMDITRLRDCCFGVTAPPDLLAPAQALVVEMGGEPVIVDEFDRTRYHLGLVHGSNYLITLAAQAAQILRGAGIEDTDRMLRPLMSAALDNALRSGDAALTGPVARGDAGTVSEHLHVLASESPDVQAVYRVLAEATLRRAVDGGRLAPHSASTLDQVLHPQEEAP
ncbi:MAG TPA: DUF2520 domain-containing protein [Tetrasphaera sp.]|uniref:Rossmann-like and DUF2520 domain-containing protein n=1 Tax=Nostocoides sp. TaxID=1917966 RepID=UPI002CB7040F|nr:Rossmann-like and DUF2520 domain-containing protein [Tetrasphaera sp.]HNQ08097.1 DUF2520 domain-containing protein [Tetrasphaera sp.]